MNNLPHPFVFDESENVPPAEIRQAFSDVAADVAHFVPPWVQRIAVSYAATEPTATMTISIDYNYRHANLVIQSGWLSGTRTDRRFDLIHEIMHLCVEPLAGWGKQTLGRLLDDTTTFKSQVLDDHEGRLESIVQDLAKIIEGTL